MEKFKGTQGEWKIYDYKLGGCIDIIPANEDENFSLQIAQVYNRTSDGKGGLEKNTKELKANAQLISAAPELLEALQYEVSLLRDVRATNGWTPQEANRHERLMKAINKALGL